jgi:hypothetical protein
MSITIKHTDGPLKGRSTNFDDNTRSILVGRSPEAQIVYPEERIEVDNEHLKLNRDDDGGWRLELCGSCDVDIDGKTAEDNDAVTSGSVITVGLDGPRFEVLLPGLTIRHLEGPLAGQHQYFPESVPTIRFGRPTEQTQVSYPANYTKVGRLHCSLKRKELGDYCLELTPKHYVEIDGLEADNGALVPSGSIFRLGHDDGPTFRAEITNPVAAGVVTEVNKAQTRVRGEIKKTSDSLYQAKKIGTYAVSGLLAGLLVLGVWSTARDFRHEMNFAQLKTDLAVADERVSELAKQDISEPAQKALLAAVYLVAKIEGKHKIGQATAWVVASDEPDKEPDKLATNAHVTEEIKGHEDEYVLIGPNGHVIKIAKVESHPGYTAFKDFKKTRGKKFGDKFKPLDVINEYDVGIIYPAEPLPADPETKKVAALELASQDQLKSLQPGAAVASVGFPIEGLAASSVVTDAPSSLRFGNISALTNVFMCKAESEDRLLIQHSVPVTGGVSGSPLIDASGKVIGVVNGGNTATVLKAAGEDEKVRIPSAALINFAQRVDLLDDMLSGSADQELAADQGYWKEAAKKFTSYFDSADENFVALAAERYGVGEVDRKEVAEGLLKPKKFGSMSFVSAAHTMTLEPGHLYGFIADAASGVMIALNVKKQGTAEFLRDEKDKRQTSVPELAPTAWVTVKEPTTVEIGVLGMTERPASYTLYVYDWSEPGLDQPASDASAAASQ